MPTREPIRLALQYGAVMPAHISGTAPPYSTSAAREGTTARLAWSQHARRRLVWGDATAVAIAVVLTHAFWPDGLSGTGRRMGTSVESGSLQHAAIGLTVGVCWVAALGLGGSRRHRLLGDGSAEYSRVLAASVCLFGLAAVIGFALGLDIVHGYVMLAFPLGLVLLLIHRRRQRSWLAEQRRKGAMSTRVLLVGTATDNDRLDQWLRARPQSGLRPAARLTITPGQHPPVTRLIGTATAQNIGAVLMTPSAHYGPHELNSLRWGLEEQGCDLVLSSWLTGLGARRIDARPVDGMPLVYVEGGHHSTGMRVAKSVFDKIIGSILLVALCPLMVVVAIAVKVTSRGPVFYRQERIGINGSTFRIWKFRSMTVDADSKLMQRLRDQGTDGQPLFKVTNDDRITPIGRPLRRWSLDELPQLFNVIAGQMSLVGPRPQRPAEVALYRGHAGRRLKLKPGMTGLWQVSGRSDLEWESALELDLYYVDNWSLQLDLALLWRTVLAVVRRHGAH